MTEQNAASLSLARRKLGNQYAFLNGEGTFDHVDKSSTQLTVLSSARVSLENPYAYLNDRGTFDHAPPRVQRQVSSSKKAENLFARIEDVARDTQIKLWLNRKTLWSGSEVGALEVLNPTVGANFFGFAVDDSSEIGRYSDDIGLYDIAGLINREQKIIRVSRSLPAPKRRFTIAHELGHLLLHPDLVMHRDRPLDDYSKANNRADPIERQANHFAVCFLMPAKLVIEAFELRFGSNPIARMAKTDSLKDRAFHFASVEAYASQRFNSLASLFGVSLSAMAYRLLELKLIA